MIKYREHRGSLEESLKTSMKFDKINELLDFIIEKSNIPIRHKGNIKIFYYGYDKRCNQELFIVSLEDYGVFGFIYEDVVKKDKYG